MRLIALVMALAAFSPAQQTDTLKLSVSAGFDGSFRENQWLPVYIRVSNDGEDVEGCW